MIQPDCGHKSCLWQIVPQDSQAPCPSPQAVFPIGEKAILTRPVGPCVDQNVLSAILSTPTSPLAIESIPSE